jgi:hypothetical protein
MAAGVKTLAPATKAAAIHAGKSARVFARAAEPAVNSCPFAYVT